MIDRRRLAELWYKCLQGSALLDCPIGPGDLLEISLPATEELRKEIRHRHDVSAVSASAPRLVPYSVYRFFPSVFYIGAGVSVPMR